MLNQLSKTQLYIKSKAHQSCISLYKQLYCALRSKVAIKVQSCDKRTEMCLVTVQKEVQDSKGAEHDPPAKQAEETWGTRNCGTCLKRLFSSFDRYQSFLAFYVYPVLFPEFCYLKLW